MYKPTSKRRKILTINFAFALSNLEILIGSAKEHSTLGNCDFLCGRYHKNQSSIKPSLMQAFKQRLARIRSCSLRLCTPTIYSNDKDADCSSFDIITSSYVPRIFCTVHRQKWMTTTADVNPECRNRSLFSTYTIGCNHKTFTLSSIVHTMSRFAISTHFTMFPQWTQFGGHKEIRLRNMMTC